MLPLLPALLLPLLLPLRLLALGRLLIHLPGQRFHLPLKLLLLAREALQLSFTFLGLLAGRLLLLPVQLLLTPREIANAIEQLLVVPLLLILPLLDLRALFVIGLLLALEFLVEQGGQILRVPVAHAAASRLLLCDLAAPDLGLRLEQPLQGRHLVGYRVTRPVRRELLDRAGHRVDG